jgi:branched-chain amino acid transport system permease protein
MTTLDPIGARARRLEDGGWRIRLESEDWGHLVGIAVVLIVGLAIFPAVLSLYWIDTFIQIAIYSVVALGLGLLVGRVGLYSLGQIAILAVGSWTAARLDYATQLPFPVILLAAGIVAAIFGVIIGLPALRLSGLDLALITLMFAGAITVVINTTNFPNGGHGFLGYTASPFGNPPIRRPSIASSDPAYLRYSIIVALLMFLLVLWHVRGKPGRAWATIRQSEPAAIAAGVNVTFYKLWAFALAAFITGIAGGVLASSAPELYNTQFATQQSIELLAVVLMGGAYNLWGAFAAGMFLYFIPALLNTWNLSAFLLIILFGVGVIWVLVTSPTGLAGQLPQDLGRLARKIKGQRSKRPGLAEAGHGPSPGSAVAVGDGAKQAEPAGEAR